MDTEKVKQNPAVEAAGSSGGQAARIFKKENIPKTAETVGRDTFEEWMGRIMERFDRQDRIISVLVNKDAAGVKYLDGERVVRQPGPVRDAEDKQTVAATLPKQVQAPLPTDWSQDLLQGIGRAGVHQPKYGGSAARRYQGAPHERATRHGSPKEQIRQKTGPQEVFT